MKNGKGGHHEVKIAGITAVLNRGLMKRRGEDTRFTHFAGTEEELMRVVLFAWCEAKFRKSSLFLNNDIYIVTVPPQLFFSKNSAKQVSDRPDGSDPNPRWEKRIADRAEAVVVIKRSPVNGVVEKLEVIDIQAWTEKVSNKQVRPEVRASA